MEITFSIAQDRGSSKVAEPDEVTKRIATWCEKNFQDAILLTLDKYNADGSLYAGMLLRQGDDHVRLRYEAQKLAWITHTEMQDPACRFKQGHIAELP